MLQEAIQYAVEVIGLIEWGKGFAPKSPGWIWRIVFPLVALGVGFIPDQRVHLALLTISIGQLGYANVVALVNKLIQSFLPPPVIPGGN
jgi:hypothetical protein